MYSQVGDLNISNGNNNYTHGSILVYIWGPRTIVYICKLFVIYDGFFATVIWNRLVSSILVKIQRLAD